VVVAEVEGEAPISFAMQRVMRIAQNGNGTRLLKLFAWWPVEGAPTEITVKGGGKRNSWPLPWAEVEKAFLELHTMCGSTVGALSASDVDAIKKETVDNPEKPWLTEECMTWPGVQNVFREAWELSYKKEFKDSEHHEEGVDWFALNRGITLHMKVEGLTKIIKELGHKSTCKQLWKIYVAWPNPRDEEVEVIRMNRKTGEDAVKKTWPLKWEAEGDCMVSVLKECGWNEDVIARLKVGLFDQQAETEVHKNCNPDQVVWPDIQQAFRHYVSPDDPWDEKMNDKWDPLAYKVTLRQKIEKEYLRDTLIGEWRMYCKPENPARGAAFSYGLVILSVDMDEMTFEGRSRTEGKYKVEDGKIDWDPEDSRCKLSYKEAWPNGDKDALTARVKSNAKFQCDSKGGFEQKATREDLNLPKGKEARIGEGAPVGVKKYYLNDGDAAADLDEAELQADIAEAEVVADVEDAEEEAEEK